jgi:TetR/AcrR family transcriptional regulator, transcriptional repressor of aconitase
VPKVSAEHSDARRTQILDGARRAFASYGYDGATVARLEEATGLSRGAIFHYFPDKLAIFVALAADTNRRFIDLIVDRGLDDAVRAMAHENRDWLGVLLEVGARLRHDRDFDRRLTEAHAPEQSKISEWFEREQAAGRLRADLEWQELGRFATMVINGLAIRIVAGDPFDLDSTLKLLNDAIAPRQ